MPTKLIDIAQKADVSKSTVSRALNDDSQINIETRKKIKRIAQELNYIPNYKAKSLANNETKIMGVVVPTIDNLFFSEFVQAFKYKAREHNYNVILCTVENSEEELKKYIDLFKGGHVDAAVFGYTKLFPEELKDLAEMNIPTIYAGHYRVEKEIFNNILYLNLKEGCYNATKYLINMGHKNISFLGEKDDRFIGFKQAMQEYNLNYNKNYIYNMFYDWFEIGKKIAENPKRPSALVCYNDDIAIAVIQSLSRAGLKIPDDISVCGFDNLKIAKKYNPPLTTVNIPKKEMGQKAAEILINCLQSEKKVVKGVKKVFDCELIKRESTSAIK